MVDVSVLVPVYNVKPYLRQCLDSLKAQTLGSIEFVCIDDGSTDGSGEILDAYAAGDARFRVIHKANSGYGASMNVGLRAAQGKYIGIVESDDFADAGMFEALHEAAEAQQSDIVKSNYYIFMEESGNAFHEMLSGLPYHVVCSARSERRLLQTDTFLWTSLYRTAFLRENGIWFHETPGASYQDVSFSLKAALCAKRVYLVPEGYLHYRMDNPEASGHKVTTKYLCYHDEIAEYLRFLKRRSAEEQAVGKAAFYNAWRIYRTSCWPYVARRDRESYLRRVIEEFRRFETDGWLRTLDWPSEAWERLQELLRNPQQQIFRCAISVQQEDLLEQGVLASLREASAWYLYGAGQVSKRILHKLQSSGLHASGILVSETAGNPSSIDSVPVYALDASPADSEHDLVIIAVTPRKPEVQQEIFSALVQAGYRNVIVLTKELQQALG
ncbi:MAG: glycosyltransferase [Selenomonas sp.]|uniref:glycosyltransferase n=1 Tax=Selenomonas sp. TaxID=2053611 RepID=UPI0025DD9A6F|nr:glycosyltransferase [Selenomonas sp.]MCI6086934.1 glycosyltransferase [Selenomonas sp.]MDY4416859.1 glycosyltransferase [Selenomonas sp.]